MSFFLGCVVGAVVGWFAKHFLGARAQAALDAEKVNLEAKIKAKL